MFSSLRLAVVPVLVAGVLACAGPASATDYCVAPNATCAPGNNVGDLQTALDWAGFSDNADRIFLGAGTYVAPLNGFSYDVPTAPVEIIGTGPGSTLLTGPSGGKDVLDLFGPPGTSIQNLGVVLPPNAAANANGVQTNGLVSRVDVTEDQSQANPRVGVRLTGGAVEKCFVGLARDWNTTAVVFDAAGLAVRDSALSSGYGVSSSFGGTVERSTLTARGGGVGNYAGTFTIAASEIDLTGPDAIGIIAAANSASPTINVDGVNVIATTVTNTAAIEAINDSGPTHTATINVDNALIRHVQAAVRAHSALLGPGGAHVVVKYSDFDGSGNLIAGPFASITESNVTNVGDSGFGPDGYQDLLPTSPLVDKGDPATPQGLDLGGKTLVTDGNGDGIARRDIGAVELPGVDPPAASGGAAVPTDTPPATPPAAQQPIATPVARDTQAPVVSSFRIRRKRFRYALSEAATVVIRVAHGKRVVARLARRATAGGNSLRIGKALRRGRYTAVLVATDAAGNHSLPKRVRFRIIGS